MRKTKAPLSVFVLQAKKRQEKKREHSVMSKDSWPLLLVQLSVSGAGDPLRPSRITSRGGREQDKYR